MITHKNFVLPAASVAASLFLLFGGCSKKNVQVALPEPETMRDTVPIVAPVAPPPVDSAALLSALLRDAMQNIYFDLDEYNLRQDAIDRLQIIGRALMEHGSVTIQIEGNCDERGSSEYNIGLGENRAKAAKKWLVSYGIAESRVQTTSYGKERLVAYGCTDEGCHQTNRRCEFKVISQ